MCRSQSKVLSFTLWVVLVLWVPTQTPLVRLVDYLPAALNVGYSLQNVCPLERPPRNAQGQMMTDKHVGRKDQPLTSREATRWYALCSRTF